MIGPTSRMLVYASGNGCGKSSLRATIDDPSEVEIDADAIARELNPVVLFDNSGSRTSRALAIVDGRIIQRADPPPTWLADRLPAIAAELEHAARRSTPREPP